MPFAAKDPETGGQKELKPGHVIHCFPNSERKTLICYNGARLLVVRDKSPSALALDWGGERVMEPDSTLDWQIVAFNPWLAAFLRSIGD